MPEKPALLRQLLNELEHRSSYWEVQNAGVSKASVGWHVEHSLLTLNLIIKTLETSNPQDYKSRFSFAKLFVLTFRKIPRGRAGAPQSVRPADAITAESMKAQFQKADSLIARLDHLEKNHFFEHPFFGHLNRKPAIQFLEIHTRHHLDIINDILQSRKQ